MRSFEDYGFINAGKVSREPSAKMVSEHDVEPFENGWEQNYTFSFSSQSRQVLCNIFSAAVVSISFGDGAYVKLGLFSGNLSLDRQYSAKLF
jgi:hypothetical protein